MTLTGSTGVLDSRYMPLGIATSGRPKTFVGYTVAGDTISSVSIRIGTDTPAIDDFTYGTAAVPLPRTALAGSVLIAAVFLWRRLLFARSRMVTN